MPRPVFVTGTILFPDMYLEKGYIAIEDGGIIEIDEGVPPPKCPVVAKGIILPRLFNSHIHIGDSCLHPAPQMGVEELVGPPDGYKHRMLRDTSPEEIKKGIEKALDAMLNGGVNGFLDFREGGMTGARLSNDTSMDRRSLKMANKPQQLAKWSSRRILPAAPLARSVSLACPAFTWICPVLGVATRISRVRHVMYAAFSKTLTPKALIVWCWTSVKTAAAA